MEATMLSMHHLKSLLDVQNREKILGFAKNLKGHNVILNKFHKHRYEINFLIYFK
jgi:hypothetical protein